MVQYIEIDCNTSSGHFGSSKTASEITLIAFRDYATICHKKENLTLYTGHYFAVGFKVRFGSTVRDM